MSDLGKKLHNHRNQKFAYLIVIALILVMGIGVLTRIEGKNSKLADGRGNMASANAVAQVTKEPSKEKEKTKKETEKEAQKEKKKKETKKESGKKTVASKDKKVTPKEAAVDNSSDPTASNDGNEALKPEKKENVTVTLEIRCDTLSNHMDYLENESIKDYIPEDGEILAKTTYKGTTDNTVFDALNTLCRNNDIQIEYNYTPVYESYYVEGINYLYEFDAGSQSGWMYEVNGWYPNYGCSSYYLSDGDTIVWKYTCRGLGDDLKGAGNKKAYRKAAASGLSTSYKKSLDYLYQSAKGAPAYGNIGGEWLMYALKLGDYNMPQSFLNAYRTSVEKALEEGYRGQTGILHDRKMTEYERVVFCYATLGWDVTNVNGVNLLTPLANLDKVNWQGVNSTAWALRAFDQGNYEIPTTTEGKQTTRKALIQELMDTSLKNGGWNLNNKGNADPDVTAMCIHALSPYVSSDKRVKAAVKKGVNALSAMQQSDGGFQTYGVQSSESAAQVICALSSLGIDADKDPRFVKQGHSVMDNFLTYYDSTVGGFRHVNKATDGYSATVNQMATEQAVYALGEYKKATFSKQKVSLSSTKKGTLNVSVKGDLLTDGSNVVLATNKSFTKNKKSTNKTTITGLKSKKTYYVKVRNYYKIGNKKIYTSYSSVKKIRIL
ncbi:MAG: DUF4430 domain-containing protein [Lachnospiraceae bacterium]|nr:DUF4430 domain-containing protein [Lachnospiraceae bacterium]